MVSWTDLRCEDAHTAGEQMPDLSQVGAFTFDAEQYRAAMDEAIRRLEELAAAERRAEELRRAQRTLRARLRRLTRP